MSKLNLQKTIRGLVALVPLLLLLAHAPAAHAWEHTSLGQRMRQAEVVINNLLVKTPTVTRAPGLSGFAMQMPLYASSPGYNQLHARTASLAGFPYAVRYNIRNADISSNTSPTLTCSSVRVCGDCANCSGNIQDMCEDFTTVNETAQLSVNAYNSIKSVEASGCSGATGTDDVMTIYASTWVYPGMPISGLEDIESICGSTGASSAGQTTSALVYCMPPQLKSLAGVTTDVFSFHSQSGTVNLSGAYTPTPFTNAGAAFGNDHSSVRIRARASRKIP